MHKFIETHVALTAAASRIAPADIVFNSWTGRSLMGRFGKEEVDRIASQLVHFYQQYSPCWERFDAHDLRMFYEKHGWDIDLPLFGLIASWADAQLGMVHSASYVQAGPDLKFAVTDEFILRCAGYNRDRIEALIREHVA